MPQEEKFTKAEVGYEHPAQGRDHCRDCIHFEVERRHTCEIVAGRINGRDWCKKFEEKHGLQTRQQSQES